MLLLFAMGVAFAMDKDSFSKIRRTGLKILIVPLAVVLGTILGGVASALILGLNVVATAGGKCWIWMVHVDRPSGGPDFRSKVGGVGFCCKLSERTVYDTHRFSDG